MPTVRMTKDGELATVAAVDARTAELTKERNAARLTASSYAGRRLSYFASQWRGKVAALSRRLNALKARRAELSEAALKGRCADCPRNEFCPLNMGGDCTFVAQNMAA